MIYNKILIICFFLFSNSYCKIDNREKKLTETKAVNSKLINQESDKIIGTWHWRSEDKSREFTLKIKTKIKDSIFAQYCAVNDNGTKLDCDFDEVNNLKGIIKNNKIYFVFYSFFGAKNGKAEIEILENNLHWKITKSPKGEYYSPESVVLNRKKGKNEIIKTNIKENNFEGTYVLKSCENSRFTIRIIKNTDYIYSILDKNKTISKGKAIISKFQIKFGKIEGVISEDKIVIQNYGNVTNKYNHFTQCDEKYLSFIRN